MRKRTRGISLLEVMIASALMLMLLFAFYGIAEMISRSRIVTEARLEARQQLRMAVRNFNLEATEGSGFYQGDGKPIKLGGYTCVLPFYNASTGTYSNGDTLAVAVPIDVTCPVNQAQDPRLANTKLATGKAAHPDGFPDNRYDITVLTTRPMRPANSRNPNARQIVLMRWENVQPATFLAPLTPATLAGLGAPRVERVFDSYLKPLDQDGFRVTYERKGSIASASAIHAEYSYKPNDGPIQAESYEYLFNTRNIF